MVRKSKKETELPNKKSEEELEPESEFDFDSEIGRAACRERV